MATSNVIEDAGVFVRNENETETKRRYSITKTIEERTERTRKTSVRFDTIETSSKIESEEYVISPEDIPDEYEQSEDESGLLVVFNQEKFAYHDDREGTTKDRDDLVDCLSRLRYEIKKELIFSNLNKQEIEDQLLKVQQMDHSKRSSLIVVFLTHGDAEGKLYSSDDLFLTCEEVWNYFSNDKCPKLKGKPKVFIFQACKGKRKSSVSSTGIQEDSVLRVEAAKKNYTLPAEADILVAYSTVEGNVSYRHILSGSWFIQELCKNITAYGRRDDLVTIITRVSKCVAYHYQTGCYKQMPCFISTLTRKFYLSRSKERGYFLDLFEQNKKLLSVIENMQKQLDNLDLKVKEITEKGNEKKEKSSKTTVSTKTSAKPRWR